MVTDMNFIGGGLSNMGFGDSLVALSMFAHYGRVRWFLKDGDPEDMGYAFNRLYPYYKHLCEVEMVFEKPKSVPTIHPWHTAAFMNLRVERPKFKKVDIEGEYFTTQFEGNHTFRYVQENLRDKVIADLGENLSSMSQDNQKHKTLDETFSELDNAKFHVGVNSGMMWAATAVGTPTKLLLVRDNQNNPQFNTDPFKGIIENHHDLIQIAGSLPCIPGVKSGQLWEAGLGEKMYGC